MKIIAKYKDYYDYYQGIYGIDNKLIFDRRGLTTYKVTPTTSTVYPIVNYTLAIAGRLYYFEYYKKKLYHSLKEMNALEAIFAKERGKGMYFRWRPGFSSRTSLQEWNTNNCETDVNLRHREPVLIRVGAEWSKNVLLKDFNLTKYVPADQMFTNISLFLGYLVDHPPIENNQTDVEKVVSHGFDTKKSFRHR